MATPQEISHAAHDCVQYAFERSRRDEAVAEYVDKLIALRKWTEADANAVGDLAKKVFGYLA